VPNRTFWILVLTWQLHRGVRQPPDCTDQRSVATQCATQCAPRCICLRWRIVASLQSTSRHHMAVPQSARAFANDWGNCAVVVVADAAGRRCCGCGC
jgi:hypothetical protein